MLCCRAMLDTHKGHAGAPDIRRRPPSQTVWRARLRGVELDCIDRRRCRFTAATGERFASTGCTVSV